MLKRKQNMNATSTIQYLQLDHINGNQEKKTPNRPNRGRQIAKKASSKFIDKNLSKQSQTSASESKTVLINNLKRKSKNYFRIQKKSQYSVEEDFKSSESEDSFSYKHKRKELFQDEEEREPQFEDIEVVSNDQSQEVEENQISSDLQLHYEDILNNKIERILIDIYNNHITANKKKRLEVGKFERNIQLLSHKFDDESSKILILQAFSDKIKELIKRYKEKIFEIPEINQMREKFLTMKAQTNQQKIVYDNGRRLNAAIMANSFNKFSSGLSVSPHSVTNKIMSYIISPNNSTSFHSFHSCESVQSSPCNKVCDRGINIDDITNKSVTRILLLELRNIKRALIKSSCDLEKIFKCPMSHLRNNGKPIRFSIEEMHREEFTKTLVEDEFISELIYQIKTIFKQIKIDEINELITQIEEDRLNKKMEMTRFTKYLDQQRKTYFEEEEIKYSEENSECEKQILSQENIDTREEVEKEQDQTSQTQSDHNNILNKNHPTFSHPVKNLTPTSASSAFSSAKKEIQPLQSVDIDDLVKFIVADDMSKPKKSKKKNKANRKKKEKQEALVSDSRKNENENENEEVKDKFEYDMEVEQFKKSISEINIKFNSNKKIKPVFTQDWIRNIQKLKTQ